MTVWKSIEEILNENPNIMINIEKTYGMQSCLSIKMRLIDPLTFRSIYNIKRIKDLMWNKFLIERSRLTAASFLFRKQPTIIFERTNEKWTKMQRFRNS